MSEPTNEVVLDRRVSVPMSDGTVLNADVYRPKEDGRYPLIVERVAYELDERVEPYADFYASRGYVFVGQNTRGAFWSEGDFEPFIHDGWGKNRDGFDTIEWAAALPWSNGKIGTMDGSWSGYTQNALAVTRPPHLTAQFQRMAPANWYQSVKRGGIPAPGLRNLWARTLVTSLRHESNTSIPAERYRALAEAYEDPDKLTKHMPPNDLPGVGDVAPLVSELLSRADEDELWLQFDATSHAGEIDTPIFHLGGWYDPFLADTLEMYSKVSESGYSSNGRENQRLLVGPWIHGPFAPDEREAGQLDFGADAVLGINEFRLRWFDFWLKGIDNGFMDEPRVRLFVMGDNKWRDYETWPPPGIDYTAAYFCEGIGSSVTSANHGSLRFDPPQPDEEPGRLEYDPENPSRSAGRAGGPIDHRHVEGQMLTFTTEPLEQDLTVIGPLRAVLHASSSASDTDWFVRLCDVWPSAESYNIQRGQLRARYRNGTDRPDLMKPEEVYRFEIDMTATAHTFKAGHRIRVHVASSDYPAYERNMNTGGDNGWEMSGQVAQNTVYHDAERPSHVILPIVKS